MIQQEQTRKDEKSIVLFGEFMKKQHIDKTAYYIYNKNEDWQEDLKTFDDEEGQTKWEVKTCNYDYTETSLTAEHATYLHWEDTPTLPKTTKELNEINATWNTKQFKPNNTKNIIPKNVRNKNIYITLTASNVRGEILGTDCKVRKMIEGDWGLGIIFKNGIKVYNPTEFKDSLLSLVWLHSKSNRLGALKEWNKKDWKLNLTLDLNKGRFFYFDVDEEIFWEDEK